MTTEKIETPTPESSHVHHVTTADKLPIIKKHGLVPAENGYLNGPATFMTSPEGTDFWKQEVTDYYGKKPVVLRTAKKNVALFPDEAGTRDAGAPAHYTTSNIPANQLEIQTENGWKPLVETR
jgi:hypothetical protein